MSDRAKVETELNFLSELERREVVTQMSLAKRFSVSVGLVNAMLKRAIKKGYVKAKAAPYKRYAYYLTPKGFNEKSRLVAQYLETSLDFFRSARQEYTQLFESETAANRQSFVLVGQGELVEIAIWSAHEVGVEIRGVDFQGEASSTTLFGVPIVSKTGGIEPHDTLVIAESRHPQSIYDQLREKYPNHHIAAPAFLCITSSPLDFSPPHVAPKGKTK